MFTIKGAVFSGLVLAGLLVGSTASATNFALLLGGSGGASDEVWLDDCRAVEVEDLIFDVREMTTGPDVEYRQYQPGKPVFGNVTFEAEQGSETSQQFREWYKKVLAGQTERKSGSVILLDRMGQEIMRYSFLECSLESVSVSEIPNDDGTVTVVEQYVTKPKKIKIGTVTGGASVGKPTMRARLMDDDGGTTTDDTLDGWSGGEPALIVTSPFRNVGSHETQPGNKLVTDLHLDIPDGLPSAAVSQWINDAVNGKPWKQQVSITDIRPNGKPGRTFIYHDCFPMRYVFPQFKKGSDTVQTETLTVKIGRIEFKT